MCGMNIVAKRRKLRDIRYIKTYLEEALHEVA